MQGRQRQWNLYCGDTVIGVVYRLQLNDDVESNDRTRQQTSVDTCNSFIQLLFAIKMQLLMSIKMQKKFELLFFYYFANCEKVRLYQNTARVTHHVYICARG